MQKPVIKFGRVEISAYEQGWQLTRFIDKKPNWKNKSPEGRREEKKYFATLEQALFKALDYGCIDVGPILHKIEQAKNEILEALK